MSIKKCEHNQDECCSWCTNKVNEINRRLVELEKINKQPDTADKKKLANPEAG